MAKKLLKTIFFYFKLAASNDDQQLDEDDINELKCVEEDDEDKSSCSWSQQPNSSSVTNLLLSPIGVPNICLKLMYSMFKVAVHNDMSNISVSLCDMYVGQFFVSFDIK